MVVAVMVMPTPVRTVVMVAVVVVPAPVVRAVVVVARPAAVVTVMMPVMVVAVMMMVAVAVVSQAEAGAEKALQVNHLGIPRFELSSELRIRDYRKVGANCPLRKMSKM